MEKQAWTKRRILCVAGILFLSALWLTLEILRFNGRWTRYQGSMELVYSWLKGLGLKASPQNTFAPMLYSVAFYSVSGLLTVWMYFYTTLLPQRTRLLQEKKTRLPCIVSGAVILTVSAVHLLLGQDGVYQALVSKWGVKGSVQNDWYNLIPALNIILIPISLAFCVAVIHVPAAVRRRKEIFTPDAVRNSAARWGLCLVIAVLCLAASGALVAMVGNFDQKAAKRVLDGFSSDNAHWERLWAMLICAPILEEMAFRGLIFGKLRKYVPLWAAIAFSALCFGLWHRNLGQFVYTAMMGVVFALGYHYTGRLRYAIFLHMANNTLSTIALAKGSAQGAILPDIPILRQITRSIVGSGNGKGMDLIPAVVLFVVLAAAIAVLLRILRKVPSVREETL